VDFKERYCSVLKASSNGNVVGRYEIDCMINIMMMVDLSWKALYCYSCDDDNIVTLMFSWY
jgi:hypothetical protein